MTSGPRHYGLGEDRLCEARDAQGRNDHKVARTAAAIATAHFAAAQAAAFATALGAQLIGDNDPERRAAMLWRQVMVDTPEPTDSAPEPTDADRERDAAAAAYLQHLAHQQRVHGCQWCSAGAGAPVTFAEVPDGDT